MPITTIKNHLDAPSQENKQNISQFLFRVLPYWHLMLIALILGITGSYLYMRNAVRYYGAQAQVIVNDNSQEKDNSLNVPTAYQDQETKLSEVEKQIEIIRSNSLLADVVHKLKLNIEYSETGTFNSKTRVSDPLLDIVLLSPASIKKVATTTVKVIPSQNQVEFENKVYPADSAVSTTLGKVIWKITDTTVSEEKTYHIKILPLLAVTEQLKKKRFSVAPLTRESSILELNIIDESAERAENILNTIIHTYGESDQVDKKRLLESTLNFIDDRLRLVSTDLKEVENSLRDYKSQGGITDLANEGQIYLGQVKENDVRLSEIEVQLNVLDEIEGYLTKRNQSANSAPATLGLSDQVLVTLLGQLFQDEFDLEKMERLSGEKNSQVIILKERIEKRKSSILESVRNLRTSLQASRRALLTNNSNYNRSLRSIPEKERTLMNITRDQGIKNELYTFLLRKREETAIAAAAIAPSYRVIEQPVSYGLVKPKALLVYMYGVLAALLISGVWVYRKEFANNKILYRSEIEQQANVPVIGEIIRDLSGKRNGVVIGAESRTLIAEQFRELRANVNQALQSESDGKVLLMTSSIPGEGKTFVSVNLAISLAFSGKRTVLVEFDLYKPKICEYLGITLEGGITDYFLGHVTPKEICHPYEIPNLRVIPAGTLLANPAELILNGKLPGLIEYLKSEFDYIIIDSPAIGVVSDTKILAPFANLSLYLIRQNYAHHSFLKFVNDLNNGGGMPNIQLVFNGITIKRAPGMDYWTSYGYNGYRYGHNNPYTKLKEKKTSSG